MRWTRKLLALVLALILVVAATPLAMAGDDDEDEEEGKGRPEKRWEFSFKDWNRGYWANESLARMAAKKVMQGYDDGTIGAQRPVSKLEAAIMLVRLLQLDLPVLGEGELTFQMKSGGKVKAEVEGEELELAIKGPGGEVEVEFEDDNRIPPWGQGAIIAALQEGFLLFEGGHINPMAPLTRWEATVMLVKAAGLEQQAALEAGADLPFRDAPAIPEDYRGYVAVALAQGLITGYDDHTFKPTKPVTRAEWAALLDRLDRQGESRDARQVKGKVTAANIGASPSISMTTPVYPQAVTYPIDDTAVFYVNGREATIADVRAGDRVIVQLSEDRKILMVTVTRDGTADTSLTLTGTVATVVYGANEIPTVGLTNDLGETRAYRVADWATITSAAGADLTLADIRVGSRVQARVEQSLIVRLRLLDRQR